MADRTRWAKAAYGAELGALAASVSAALLAIAVGLLMPEATLERQADSPAPQFQTRRGSQDTWDTDAFPSGTVTDGTDDPTLIAAIPSSSMRGDAGPANGGTGGSSATAVIAETPEPALIVLVVPVDTSSPERDAESTAAAETPRAPETPAAAETPAAGIACGPNTCQPGQVCCNASCGTCVQPGEGCNQEHCGMLSWAVSVNCGPNTCNVGELCCNPTCGVCTRPGRTCDKTPCTGAPEIPFSFTCGMMATCNVGYVCCNPSCGICARPGEACSHEICD